MTDIPLLLDSRSIHIKLDALLENYFKEETIKFERQCDYCKKICPHIKISKIYHLPQILILSIQRFNPETHAKIETKIDFNECINLSKYIDEFYKKENEEVYNLIAEINHSGSLEYGHYYSFINFYKKNIWYEFNDKEVFQTNKDLSLYFDTSYILFYEKVDK